MLVLAGTSCLCFVGAEEHTRVLYGCMSSLDRNRCCVNHFADACTDVTARCNARNLKSRVMSQKWAAGANHSQSKPYSNENKAVA